MTVEELTTRLASEKVVSLPTPEWESMKDAFEEVERHATFIAGDLVIVRRHGVLYALEEPSSRERVLRRLHEDEVRSFVRDRLETYERMWDGCGCRVEYYG